MAARLDSVGDDCPITARSCRTRTGRASGRTHHGEFGCRDAAGLSASARGAGFQRGTARHHRTRSRTMAASNSNRVVITGNLTRDPELRSLESGTSSAACGSRPTRAARSTASGPISPTTSASASGARRARTAPASSPPRRLRRLLSTQLGTGRSCRFTRPSPQAAPAARATRKLTGDAPRRRRPRPARARFRPSASTGTPAR
jgi:hypothetical protein